MEKEISDLLRAAGVESISDYIGLYAESENDEGLKEWTERSTNFKNNKILRDTPSMNADDVDLEAPLPADVKQKQDDSFSQKYKLKLPLELTPAARCSTVIFVNFDGVQKLLTTWPR